MIRAALFDLDGTLGDTLPLCIEAFRRTVFAHRGTLVDDEAVTRYFGASDRGVLAACLPGEDVEALMREYMGYYRELHPVLAPAPFPWVKELLARLQQSGIQLAMVTGKEPESAHETLGVFGLTEFFERVETGNRYRVVKAECIERLLGDWGLEPQQAIYVGDAPSDVRACHRVGVPVIAAAWASSADPAALRAERPQWLLTDAAGLEDVLLNPDSSRGSLA